LVRKVQWHDYENGKKKEYGEFEVCEGVRLLAAITLDVP